MSVFSNICRDVDIWGREGVTPPTEKTAHFAGQLNLRAIMIPKNRAMYVA